MHAVHDFNSFVPSNALSGPPIAASWERHKAPPALARPATGARSIRISSEISCFIGAGDRDLAAAPDRPIFVGFGDGTEITIGDADGMMAGDHDHPVVIAIGRSACRRLFGWEPGPDTRWHQPPDLHALCQALAAIQENGEAPDMLRAARGFELLSASIEALKSGRLVEMTGQTRLRECDVLRIAQAKRIVDELWRSPITVKEIARKCGLSRSMLLRGFRDLYCCSVAEAVAERRLSGAKKLLLQSDLRISTIGYRCGYTNNASFSRAFARHFGVTPSQMREGASG